MKLHAVNERLDANHADLSGSTFVDVNLAGSTFENVNLSGWTVRDANVTGLRLDNANLAGARISDANMTGVSISDCRLDGMTIDGVAVSDLFAAYRVRAQKEPGRPTSPPDSSCAPSGAPRAASTQPMLEG